MIKKNIFLLFLTYLLSAVLFYAPYIVKNRFNVVERNWDGPAYIVIAKTFYNPDLIKKENYIRKYIPNPKQFTEKFPLTAVFIRVFSFMSYEKSMIFTSLLFGFLSIVVFYQILIQLKIKRAFFISVLYIFLPARWFVLQKVGGAEAIFLFFALLSIYLYLKNKYFLSSISLLFCTLTKINALLLVLSYFCIFLFLKRRKIINIFFYFLPIFGVIALFYYYFLQYGNFFVYFQTDARCFESLSLFKMPYSVFDASACYVGTIHLDDMFWFYGIGFLAILKMLKEGKRELLMFFLPSFIPMIFLAHLDFTRHGIFLYFLFGIIFSNFLVKKEVRIILILLIPAVYLYARNFVNVNIFIP